MHSNPTPHCFVNLHKAVSLKCTCTYAISNKPRGGDKEWRERERAHMPGMETSNKTGIIVKIIAFFPHEFLFNLVRNDFSNFLSKEKKISNKFPGVQWGWGKVCHFYLQGDKYVYSINW